MTVLTRIQACAVLCLTLAVMAMPTQADNNETSQVDRAAVEQAIDVNRASVEELANLHNVGIKKAQEIIKYRQEHGDFQSIDELTNVKGIGKGTVDKNRGRLLVSQ